MFVLTWWYCFQTLNLPACFWVFYIRNFMACSCSPRSFSKFDTVGWCTRRAMALTFCLNLIKVQSKHRVLTKWYTSLPAKALYLIWYPGCRNYNTKTGIRFAIFGFGFNAWFPISILWSQQFYHFRKGIIIVLHFASDT